MLGVAAFLYFVLLGGTPVGDIEPDLRTANALVGGVLIALWVIQVRRSADRIDRLMLLGLVLFVLACALSLFPRQSFDAALAAAAYVAAFYFMRSAVRSAPSRRLLIAALRTLSLFLTLFFASLWLPEVLAWRAATGDLPPLGLRVPSLWWGHRYDVGLLLLLLLPSWWIGRPSPLRFALGTVTTCVSLILVVLTGSRTLWLAAIVASVFAIAPYARGYLGARRFVRWAAAGFAVVGAVTLLVTGLGEVIVGRVLASETVVARGEMWLILTKGALEHPLGGFGPGSFPWILQATDYFDTNSWAPRHPDSSVFQLIAEAGLLGLAAATAWVVAIAPPIWRSRIVAARCAVALFAIACFATSATDFGFLVIVVLAWVALAAPRQEAASLSAVRSRPAMRVALLAASAVVVLAFLSMTAGMYAYGSATEAIASASIADGRMWLARAVTLDPGMALYWRQRGALELQAGDIDSARSDLGESIRINPYDDLAWRTKAVAELVAGDEAEARSLAQSAVNVQRADPTNLLLSAWLARQGGDDGSAIEALEEVVQSWPEVVGAPGWRAMLPSGISTADVMAGAAKRWADRAPSPQPPLDQIVWLDTLGGLDLPERELPANQLGPELTAATRAVLSCSSEAAEALNRVPEADRRSPTYWALLVRQTGGIDGSLALTLHDTIASGSLQPRSRVEILSPLDENGTRGFSVDKWGYRRNAVIWQADDIQLPSPEWGYLNWIRDPAVAIAESGLASQLPDCP